MEKNVNVKFVIKVKRYSYFKTVHLSNACLKMFTVIRKSVTHPKQIVIQYPSFKLENTEFVWVVNRVEKTYKHACGTKISLMLNDNTKHTPLLRVFVF